MITNLKPYPAYKPSGVEWLGEVPEHWEVVPLKRIAWFKSGAGFPVGEQGCHGAEIPFLRVSDDPDGKRYLDRDGRQYGIKTNGTATGCICLPSCFDHLSESWRSLADQQAASSSDAELH